MMKQQQQKKTKKNVSTHDQSTSQLLPDKFLLAVEDHEHRDPQLVVVKRTRGCGVFSPTRDNYITPHPFKSRGLLWKRKETDCERLRCWMTSRKWCFPDSMGVAQMSSRQL